MVVMRGFSDDGGIRQVVEYSTFVFSDDGIRQSCRMLTFVCLGLEKNNFCKKINFCIEKINFLLLGKKYRWPSPLELNNTLNEDNEFC